MSLAPTRFSDGARWVRADFHLHTLKEPGASRKGYRADFRDRESDFSKEFVTRLKEEQVEIGIVTNHNYFDLGEFKNLRKLARKEGILLLPGVELGIRSGSGGIHTLIVFDPEDWLPSKEGADHINRFLSSQFNAQPDEGTRTQEDLCGVLKKLESYGFDYFVVFAHCETDNGFFSELDGGMIPELIKNCGKTWSHRVLGFQKIKNRDGILKIWPNDCPFPASVEGSDPHNFSEVARQNDPCFLKIGELSFDAIKFALHDHQQRVRTGERPSEPNPPFLSQIGFVGGRLDGQVYPLNSQLTCLIGSRGSGKSSVIETLRYALGIEPGSDDARYKNGLVEAVLANGGEIHVSGTGVDGSAFVIKRSLGYTPRVFLEGKETRLQPSDVIPNLLYFGQKDLGNRHDGFEREFFEQLVGRRTAADFEKEEQLEAKVRKAVDYWQGIREALDKERGYREEADNLRDKLEIYKKHGIEKQLEQLTRFDNDKRNLAELIDRFRELLDELGEVPDEWKELTADWPEVKSKPLESLAPRLRELKSRTSEANDGFEATISEYQEILSELEQRMEALLEIEKEQQDQFIDLQRKAKAPEGLDLQTFRKQKSRFEALEKLLKASKNSKSARKEALDSTLEAASQLHDLRRARHRQEEKALNKKGADLPSALKLELLYEADREAFRDFLAGLVSGLGVRRKTLEMMAKEYANGLILIQKRDELFEKLDGTADLQKIRTAIAENLADLLNFQVPSVRGIFYEGKSIDALSLGQRATALLQLLMSVEGHPLFIIDQPEDDLDNETIFRNVVEPLLDKKKKAQFIVATHNPNIPVLGDAELVHACRPGEPPQGGSLDSSVTRDAIVSIMEGGRQAFDKRQQVYQQWTNSP